jgi:hypothetical protein
MDSRNAGLAFSADCRLDNGGGGYAGKSDLPDRMSLKPGTKDWRFAGRSPMPDHIAFSVAEGRRMDVSLAVRFASGAPCAADARGRTRQMHASSKSASFACCPRSAPEISESQRIVLTLAC